MNLFKAFGTELSYEDLLQLDGTFSISHINYGNSPEFNEQNGINIARDSRKNKLAFSVAVHLDSEIMLMDEILAVGDVQFQQKCIDKMRQSVQDQGKTIIYVSHNMNTVRQREQLSSSSSGSISTWFFSEF